MKAKRRDGAVSERASKQMRREKLGEILSAVPKTFSADLMTLTVCYRYAESLLENPHIGRYLMKYHANELAALKGLLERISAERQKEL